MKQPLKIHLLGICLVLVWTTPPAISASAVDSQDAGLGRENPFARMDRTVETVTEAPDETPQAIPELAFESIVLKFLNAVSLKPVLDRMVLPYGTVAVNPENNSVVICDTPEKLARIVGELAKADHTPEQVVIEVLILDVQLDDDGEIGVNWDLLTSDRPNAIYRQNLTSSRIRSTIEDATTVGDATAFNSVGLGGDFSVISGTVRAVLHMIQQKRDVEILASPSTRVVSGQLATIKAVEEIPYQEITDTAAGGANALTTTQFKEVGVSLQVAAVVADSNNIMLTVETEQNVRTGQSESGIPVVDTRRATTSLVLKDSQIVVIGGLRRQESTKEVRQIPLLGDVPLLGNLFKSTRKIVHQSELVVLLSPHIDRGEPIPEPIIARYEALKDSAPLSGGAVGTKESESPTDEVAGRNAQR